MAWKGSDSRRVIEKINQASCAPSDKEEVRDSSMVSVFGVQEADDSPETENKKTESDESSWILCEESRGVELLGIRLAGYGGLGRKTIKIDVVGSESIEIACFYEECPRQCLKARLNLRDEILNPDPQSAHEVRLWNIRLKPQKWFRLRATAASTRRLHEPSFVDLTGVGVLDSDTSPTHFIWHLFLVAQANNKKALQLYFPQYKSFYLDFRIPRPPRIEPSSTSSFCIIS